MCHITPKKHGRRESVLMRLMSEISDVVETYNKSDSSTLTAIADIVDFANNAFDEAFRTASTEWATESDSSHESDSSFMDELFTMSIKSGSSGESTWYGFTQDEIDQWN